MTLTKKKKKRALKRKVRSNLNIIIRHAGSSLREVRKHVNGRKKAVLDTVQMGKNQELTRSKSSFKRG